MKKLIPLFVIIIMLFSCAPNVYYSSFDNIQRNSGSEEINVYTTPQSIPYKFKEIGLISIQYQGNKKNDSEIINLAKDKAKKVGADGILLISDETKNDGYFTSGNNSLPYRKNVVKFSALTKLSNK